MTIDVFRLRPVLALACCVVVVAVWAQGFARAQQGEATDAARFTGVSRALDTEGLRVSHRWFEAGAYTAWHRHTEGQLLFVEEGRARVQQRGGPMRELALAESHYTPPNVEHWHGATPDTPFTQVALAFGGSTDWLEKVTPQEYGGR